MKFKKKKENAQFTNHNSNILQTFSQHSVDAFLIDTIDEDESFFQPISIGITSHELLQRMFHSSHIRNRPKTGCS